MNTQYIIIEVGDQTAAQYWQALYFDLWWHVQLGMGGVAIDSVLGHCVPEHTPTEGFSSNTCMPAQPPTGGRQMNAFDQGLVTGLVQSFIEKFYTSWSMCRNAVRSLQSNDILRHFYATRFFAVVALLFCLFWAVGWVSSELQILTYISATFLLHGAAHGFYAVAGTISKFYLNPITRASEKPMYELIFVTVMIVWACDRMLSAGRRSLNTTAHRHLARRKLEGSRLVCSASVKPLLICPFILLIWWITDLELTSVAAAVVLTIWISARFSDMVLSARAYCLQCRWPVIRDICHSFATTAWRLFPQQLWVRLLSRSGSWRCLVFSFCALLCAQPEVSTTRYWCQVIMLFIDAWIVINLITIMLIQRSRGRRLSLPNCALPSVPTICRALRLRWILGRGVVYTMVKLWLSTTAKLQCYWHMFDTTVWHVSSQRSRLTMVCRVMSITIIVCLCFGTVWAHVNLKMTGYWLQLTPLSIAVGSFLVCCVLMLHMRWFTPMSRYRRYSSRHVDSFRHHGKQQSFKAARTRLQRTKVSRRIQARQSLVDYTCKFRTSSAGETCKGATQAGAGRFVPVAVACANLHKQADSEISSKHEVMNIDGSENVSQIFISEPYDDNTCEIAPANYNLGKFDGANQIGDFCEQTAPTTKTQCAKKNELASAAVYSMNSRYLSHRDLCVIQAVSKVHLAISKVFMLQQTDSSHFDNLSGVTINHTAWWNVLCKQHLPKDAVIDVSMPHSDCSMGRDVWQEARAAYMARHGREPGVCSARTSLRDCHHSEADCSQSVDGGDDIDESMSAQSEFADSSLNCPYCGFPADLIWTEYFGEGVCRDCLNDQGITHECVNDEQPVNVES